MPDVCGESEGGVLQREAEGCSVWRNRSVDLPSSLALEIVSDSPSVAG